VRLILASGSPRRAELLAAAGFTFEVRAPSVDERVQTGEDPQAHVLRLAQEKARAVDGGDPDLVVLGADTVVVIDGLVLGKPADDRDAIEMLGRLSGRAHEVLTGIAVRGAGRLLTDVSRTTVRFVPLSPGEIAWYVASGEPRDKAGAYAIQGLASRFVDRIEGSYSNVVGLPIAAVYDLLKVLQRAADTGYSGVAGISRNSL